VGSWIDRLSRKNSLVVGGLGLLALLQVGAIVASVSRPDDPPIVGPPDLLIGQAFLTIPGRDSLAKISDFPLRRKPPTWTVLLAFSPTCAWCDSVAPHWRLWTNGIGSQIRVVGVVSADPAAALRYTHAHQWRLADLIVVDSAVTGVLGRQLTRKTPWLFLFDSAGVLRYSGHGNEHAVIDSLVRIAQ
jgi:hypothetical protein